MQMLVRLMVMGKLLSFVVVVSITVAMIAASVSPAFLLRRNVPAQAMSKVKLRCSIHIAPTLIDVT